MELWFIDFQNSTSLLVILKIIPGGDHAWPAWMSPTGHSSQQSMETGWMPPRHRKHSATNCVDNILGCFSIILQNQIARVDSFTNLTKRWVLRFRLNASISSHDLISFGKYFHAKGPMHACQKYYAWILEPSGHILHWILWNIFCFLMGWSFLGCRQVPCL